MLVFGALALTFTRPRLPISRVQGADSVSFFTRLRRQHWSFLRSPLFLSVVSPLL